MNIHGVTTLLQVFDMDRSVAFYRDVLGFAVVSTYEPEDHFYWAMLKLGDITLMLNAAYEDDVRPPLPNPARIAAHADVAGGRERLLADRLCPDQQLRTHQGARTAFVGLLEEGVEQGVLQHPEREERPTDPGRQARPAHGRGEQQGDDHSAGQLIEAVSEVDRHRALCAVCPIAPGAAPLARSAPRPTD